MNIKNLFVALIGFFYFQCLFSSETFKNITEDLSTFQKMPFKIGFEFQESSGLCPWAKNNKNIQNEPLFTLSIEHQKLWHVVIDTDDIEFVTQPFNNNEIDELNKCIKSIISTFNILKSLLYSSKKASFSQWVNCMKENFKDTTWCVNTNSGYDLVKDGIILLPLNHQNFKFSPQVTIQHPLQFTIPLYYGLFGFDSNYMLNFNASFPLRNIFLDYINEADYADKKELIKTISKGPMQKLNGLVFLHSHALVSMTPNDADDANLLQETQDHSIDFNQFDAKMKLTLMSRRPFSSMFKDLKSDKNYSEYFLEVMDKNDMYKEFYEVPNLFNKTNYAEQFFSNTGEIQPLYNFKNFLNPKIIQENEEKINYLLKQGIISTVMLRNFKNNIIIESDLTVSNLFENYYQMATKSVFEPKKTYIIDTNIPESPLKALDSEHDVLSPPMFLTLNDSMGKIKKDEEIDKNYGEAIIEIRSIRNVQGWFLKQCELDGKLTGRFLESPTDILVDQTNKLFNFLSKFDNNKCYEVFEGVSHALEKYKM